MTPDYPSYLMRFVIERTTELARMVWFKDASAIAHNALGHSSEPPAGHHPWKKRERPRNRTSSWASVVTRPSAQAVYSRFPWVRGTRPGVPAVSLVGKKTARSSRAIWRPVWRRSAG